MYTQFLGLALNQASEFDRTPTKGEALVALLQCRGRLYGVGSEGDGSAAATDALAKELDYDVALVTLSRLCGVTSDLHSFDRPQEERLRLERALLDQGIRLDSDTGTAQGQ